MTLSDILKTYRHNHGMTQVEFSKASGISLGTVCCIEQEHKNPRTGKRMKTSSDVLVRIAKITGYTYNEILNVVQQGSTIQTVGDDPTDGMVMTRTEKEFCLKVRQLPVDVRTWMYKSVGVIPDPTDGIIETIPD